MRVKRLALYVLALVTAGVALGALRLSHWIILTGVRLKRFAHGIDACATHLELRADADAPQPVWAVTYPTDSERAGFASAERTAV